jgi:hypothetical protein
LDINTEGISAFQTYQTSTNYDTKEFFKGMTIAFLSCLQNQHLYGMGGEA